MTEIDNLFNTLLTNISKKLDSQTNEINQLKSQISELTNLNTYNINEIKQLKLQLSDFKTQPSQSDFKNQPNQSNQSDLTTLPAYKYANVFKEVRRPVNLNELYMMVLQSQHTVYELQTQTDNILRRN